MRRSALFFIGLVNMCVCRDFYVGMFKKNDLLVAQDRLYKERVPYRSVVAKYGRIFHCPITYFRIVDRLGIGRGPRVEIIRGGLLKKFVVLRLTSPYNYPISVNVYVSCENKIPPRTAPPLITTEVTEVATADTVAKDSEGSAKSTTVADGTTVSADTTVAATA